MPKSRRHKHLAAIRRLPRRTITNSAIALDNQEDIRGAEGLLRRQEIFKTPEDANYSSDMQQNVLISVEVLKQLGEKLHCNECGDSCVLSVPQNRLAPEVKYNCIACERVVFSAAPPKVTSLEGTSTNFDGKKMCLVHDSLVNGGGYAGFTNTCNQLDVSGLGRPNYYKYFSFLLKEITIFQSMMEQRVLDGLRKVYGNLSAGNADVQRPADGIVEVDATFDGSWMTRGHHSHIGVGFVMDSETGTVLDFEVLSNFCQQCLLKEKALSPEDFATWKERHSSCAKNFDGKSGMMETEAAVRMWSRSEARGFRYRTFIGDGDSSAFNAVASLNDGAGPYDSCKVVKEECINHFAKRLSSRLFAYKAGKTQMHNVLVGKHGLTENTIAMLQKHFNQNLQNQQPSDTVHDLRNRILSTYYHGTSTDANPRHEYCPSGPDSWCFFQKAVALGVQPASHTTKSLYFADLSPELCKKILKVYLDLTSQDLLKKCLKKKTQNSNESLHSKLWRKCLKVKHAGLARVKYAASVTTLEHNFGYSQGSITAVLGLLSEKSFQAKQKKDRTPVKLPPAKRRRVHDNDEAGPSSGYAPGHF